MKNILILMSSVFITSCASIGAIIDGGKDLTTSVIDSTVKTAGNITNAALEDVAAVVETVADSTEGIVDNVVEEIDEQTNELQDTEKEEEQQK
tara:strand:+ start:51 stop:329 length:279 start_codon:yes stop_codon:yes gene_type:complete